MSSYARDSMLERVALGQSRFMTPGVAPDPRGVLLGRYGLLAFPSLEGVVSWLRLYAAESSLDELLSGLEIHQARTPLHSREMLVRFPASSSYTMDRAARCVRLAGGALYTGTAKHFVKYRDDRSPYGYDAVDIHALPQGADLMLHSLDFTQTYTLEGQLAFDKLLFRLSLRRVPGGHTLGPDERADLLLVVAPGLGQGVIHYLWRNRVEASVGLVRPRGSSAFAGGGPDAGHLLGGASGDVADMASYLVVRPRHLPERILSLFMATPGIDVFRWSTPRVAVQVGFDHVIDLGSCASVFEDDRVYLFWGDDGDRDDRGDHDERVAGRAGRSDRVDILDGPLQLSGIEHLTRVHLQAEVVRARGELDPVGAASVDVNIELAPSLVPPRHVIATLIPLAQQHLLKRLIYFLPRISLRGHRVAVTDRGILLVASEDIDVVPLGQLLGELAPGLLVPVGMDLVPRVAPDVLARALGHETGRLTVFPHHEPPFQVVESALQPLERRTLARIQVEAATTVDTRIEPAADPSVINDPVGRFALWGFSPPPSRSGDS